MAWNLDGTFEENCSCDAICPCTWSNMERAATNDDCRAALLFDIESGDVDGVDGSGTSVLMVIQTPPMMLDGNWKAGLVIDDAASDTQVEALGSVFSGALGGPPGALGPLIAEFLGSSGCRSSSPPSPQRPGSRRSPGSGWRTWGHARDDGDEPRVVHGDVVADDGSDDAALAPERATAGSASAAAGP